MSFIPSLFRVFSGAIVLLGATVFLNVSSDTERSEALLAMGAQAKEKCITVDGKRVCLEEGAKKKNDDDDDDDKPKKKKGGDDTGLTDCTIQQSGGGGGCKGGFKRVCEKMKGGKKCCGCVPDPNAKTQTTPVQAQPKPVQAQTFCCFPSFDGVSKSGRCGPTEAQARELASAPINGKPPTSIKCAPKS